MNERDKILAKIKKCLALSASSNEHEANAAFRQARKLMDAHGISELDVHAAEAEEHRAKAGAETKPPNWEASLAARVGDAFGCKVIFRGGAWRAGRRARGEWSYIGCGAAPEVAQYTFTVLARQARYARECHIKARLKRCKPATKTRRADLFSEGWVLAVTDTIDAFAGPDQHATAIAAYVAAHYPALRDLEAVNRNSGRRLRDHEFNDFAAGHESGRDVQLNRGVAGGHQPLALE